MIWGVRERFQIRRPSEPRWRPYKLSTFKRLDLTAEQVLRELARIGFSDIRSLFDEQGVLRPIHTLDEQTAAMMSSLEHDAIYSGTGKNRKLVGHTNKVKCGTR